MRGTTHKSNWIHSWCDNALNARRIMFETKTTTTAAPTTATTIKAETTASTMTTMAMTNFQVIIRMCLKELWEVFTFWKRTNAFGAEIKKQIFLFKLFVTFSTELRSLSDPNNEFLQNYIFIRDWWMEIKQYDRSNFWHDTARWRRCQRRLNNEHGVNKDRVLIASQPNERK